MTYGVKDIVLDPGTFINEGLPDTINNFTMLRRAATKGGEELAGLPLWVYRWLLGWTRAKPLKT